MGPYNEICLNEDFTVCLMANTGGLYLVLAAIVVLRRDNSGKMMMRRFSVEEKHQVRTHSYLLDLLINEIRNLKFDLIAVRNILPHPWDSNYLDQRQNE